MPRLYVMSSLLVLGALGFCLPLPAGAAYYRYETDNGSLAFTDDAARIPARYQDSAVSVLEQSLHDWDRTTRVEPAPPRAPKASPQPLRQVESAVAPARNMLTLDVADEIEIDVPAWSDEPIIVEKRVFRSDGRGTVEYTIVRQGDRVLMEVREPLVDWIEP
jgi:hypothetical protein